MDFRTELLETCILSLNNEINMTNKFVFLVAAGAGIWCYKLSKKVKMLEKAVSDLGKNGTDGDDFESDI